MTVVVVAFAFLAQILLALGPASCGQQLRPCCGGPNQVRSRCSDRSQVPHDSDEDLFRAAARGIRILCALIAAADRQLGLAEEYLRGVRKVATLSAAEWGNEPTVSR